MLDFQLIYYVINVSTSVGISAFLFLLVTNNVEHIFILHYMSTLLCMSAVVLVLVTQILLINVFAGNFP